MTSMNIMTKSVTVYMPEELYQVLEAEAKKQNETVNGVILRLLIEEFKPEVKAMSRQRSSQ